MSKVVDIAGKTMLRVDKGNLTPSKLKCLESDGAQQLLEAWVAGDVNSEDATFWLLFQLHTALMTAGGSDRGIRPVL